MMSAPDFKFKQVVIVFLRNGEIMSFKNDNLIVKDKDNKIKHQSSCYRIFVVFLVGHCTITSGLLERSKKFGFSIVMMGYSMKVNGYWRAATEGNVLLRKKQYSYDTLDIAKHLVSNKIYNQISFLKQIRNKDETTKIGITKLGELSNRIFTQSLDLYGLLGIEGTATRIYFREMFSVCGWKGRKPRAKIDCINTLLDIGYTLLFNFIEALLHLYGFDIYQGVYHQLFYQRKSLVCDIIEPFRPIIDYAIRIAFKQKRINVDDFYIRDGRYFLFGENSKKYVELLISPILTHKDKIFLYVQSYYRSFMREKAITDFPFVEFEK